METISVVISALNEENHIKRCLSSIVWADEIIFVDNGSTDRTLFIAKSFTSKIYHKQNNSMLNVNKNFGFTKATGNWLLSLDADEEITSELAKEIKETIRKPKADGYWIARKNIIFGKWVSHGLWWPDRQLRLFRRGQGKFPCKHVHEYIEVEGLTEILKEPYVHYNYDSISQFLRKMDTLYTESEVQKLRASDYRVVWYDALRFPISDFVKIYFAQEAYKDGLHGLVLSLLQSFYSFVVFAKLWEYYKFKDQNIPLHSISDELKKSKKEVYYWIFEAEIKESQSALFRIYYKVLRRIWASL